MKWVTDVGDSFEDMKTRAAYRHFNFPYLYDGETTRLLAPMAHCYAPPSVYFSTARESCGMRAGRSILRASGPLRMCATLLMLCSRTSRAGGEDAVGPRPLQPNGLTRKKAGKKSCRNRAPAGQGVMSSGYPIVTQEPDREAAWSISGLTARSPFQRVARSGNHVPHVWAPGLRLVTVSINYPDEQPGASALEDTRHQPEPSAGIDIYIYATMAAFDS